MENTNLNTTPQAEAATPNEAAPAEKTYTQEQMTKLVEAQVQQAVLAEQKKYQAQATEAEKLKNMNEEQKLAYKLEQKQAELEAKERDFNIMMNKVEAQNVLSSKGLPVDAVEYIVAADAQTMMMNIEKFELMFNSAVNDKIKKQLGGNAPKAGSVAQSGMSKEDFKNMTVSQKAELFRTNRTLFDMLSK